MCALRYGTASWNQRTSEYIDVLVLDAFIYSRFGDGQVVSQAKYELVFWDDRGPTLRRVY